MRSLVQPVQARTLNLWSVEAVRFRHADGSYCRYHGNDRACPKHKSGHTSELMWRDGFKNIVVTAGLNILLGQTFDAVASAVLWYGGLIGAGTGNVDVTSGAASVTGHSTSFANGDNGSDILIVGAGAAGDDKATTVSGNPGSSTALTLAANAGTTVSAAAYAIEPRAADTMGSKSFNETAPYSNSVRPTWTKNGSPSGGAMSNSSSKMAFTCNALGRVFGCFLVNQNTPSGSTGTLYGGGLFATRSRAVDDTTTLNVQADLSATSA